MIRASMLAAAAALAAAYTPPADPTPDTPQEVAETMPRNADEATAQDTCGAAAHQSAVGQMASSVAIPAEARVVGPDTVVTQDFVPTRLNFITDAEGRITEIRCY